MWFLNFLSRRSVELYHASVTPIPSNPLPRLLVNRRQVAGMVGLCERMISGMVSAGRFPRPHKLGRRSVWKVAEVEAWVAQLRHGKEVIQWRK